jgi:UDP-glucose 4-epimerase
MFETLATFTELSKADEFASYYRVAMDSRDLNYDQYFTSGDELNANWADYTSHNTERLTLAAVKKVLLSLPEVQTELHR